MKLIDYYKALRFCLRRFWITAGQNIQVHKTVKIYSGARLQCRGGGKIHVGANTEILDYAMILTYGGAVRIGESCSINPFTIIYGHGGITIGNNVLIAGSCMIIPNTHRYDRKDLPINKQGCIRKGITIGNDVWLGHGCTIFDGVTIGDGSIVAAGAVVRENVLEYTIVGGIPARILKSR